MEYTDEVMSIIIKIFTEEGIVTRNEITSIDSRSFTRGLVDEMKKRGFNTADYREVDVDNYRDYSAVLYDKERYSSEEAINFLKKHVLGK